MLATMAALCAATLAPAQTVTTIYNFAGNGISGATPWYVTLVQGTNGNLYGTTYNGGARSGSEPATRSRNRITRSSACTALRSLIQWPVSSFFFLQN